MTALSVVQEASAWLALPIPPALFTATAPQTVQLRELLNEEQTELTLWPDKAWPELTKEQQFLTIAAEVQPDALPTDFGRFLDESIWDRTQRRPVYGPLTPQQWQQQKASVAPTQAYYSFRIRGSDWLMTPIPPDGDTICYEYVSALSVMAAGDPVPSKALFTTDTDTSIFPEIILSRGVRWRFLRAKGMPYSEEYKVWFELVQRHVSRGGGMPTINIQTSIPPGGLAIGAVPLLGGGPAGGTVTQITAGSGLVALPGNPITTTGTLKVDTNTIATVDYVNGAILDGLGAYAPLASPVFSGDPRAVTQPVADNDTSIATTAFVHAAFIASGSGSVPAVGATPPATPFDNQLWFNSDASSGGGNLYIRFNDGNSTQWVSATPIGGNVSNSGTPAAGQIATWADATHVQGVPSITVSAGRINMQSDGITIAKNVTPAATGASTSAGTAIKVDLNISGSGSSSGTVPFNAIISNDTSTLGSGSSPGGNVIGSLMYIEENFGTATLTGARNALGLNATQYSKTGNTALNYSYSALAAGSTMTDNDNGTGLTSTTARGINCTINAVAQLTASATNIYSLSGMEINTSAQAGSSMYAKQGLLICQTTGDAVHGTVIDSALGIADTAGGSIGWKVGIQFGQENGTWPVVSTGTIIGTQRSGGGSSAGTVTNGIDFSDVAFTGNAWKSPGVTLGKGGDTNPAVLFNGNTMGVRFGFGAGASTIEGVDNTGNGSYQPLAINASVLTLGVIGVGGPAWGIPATGYWVPQADNVYDIGQASQRVRNIVLGGVAKLGALTVATLPAAATIGAGAIAYVTDANSTTLGGTAAGGGTNKMQVMSNGTAWKLTANVN